MNQPPILIVDDNPQNVQLAAQALATVGRPLAFAQSGPEALRQIELIHPDLILLDVMMPGMDGFEVCRKLQENPETAEIPVIFLTAKNDDESLSRGFAIGGVDYVGKPFNPAEVRARVNTHLRLRGALRELKAANAAKDRFFSIISHDLKGPFNGLVGISDLLVEEFDQMAKEEMLPLIEGMNNSSRTGYRLLQQLLEWARAQTGRIEYHPGEVDLSALVVETKNLLSEQARTKNIELVLDVPLNAKAWGDRNMLLTVLRNLTSNAIKFSHPATEVSLSAEAIETGWQVCVSDRGVGMDQAAQEKLFQLDKPMSTEGTSGEEGTGLGLLLVHEFIKRHDGQLWVESAPQEGSRFYFTLAKPAP